MTPINGLHPGPNRIIQLLQQELGKLHLSSTLVGTNQLHIAIPSNDPRARSFLTDALQQRHWKVQSTNGGLLVTATGASQA